jgi:hypothetical protein
LQLRQKQEVSESKQGFEEQKKKAKVPGTKGTVAKTSRNRVLEKARKER